ncbi:MAG: heme ABC exporter ATP-binding protein CcmA [Oceanicaulis sp.]
MSLSTFPPASIACTSLALSRGGRTLLSGFSLKAAPGEAVVLLGPNGSGKTTLLRALAGVFAPSDGEVAVEPGPEAVALLAHADGLKTAETVEDALKFWTSFAGGAAGRIDQVVRDLAVAHLARRPCGTLSAGQKRRAALARVVLSQRPIWLLDEPAAPLDTKSRQRLAALAADHRARGGIVIAATHVDLGWEGARVLELGS